ncbi:MAG: pentapeptide repeat-containing protein [Cyanobacteria bacterium P01_E01_bin.42]
MADEEQLKILRQGVKEWNQWRKENLVRVDLRGANLSNINLTRVDFFKADLSCAKLSNANLSYANLSEVSLFNTNLFKANLSNANFRNTNLSNANLISTDLSNANLFSTNLFKANLSQANLFKADLSNANLGHANLSHASLQSANLGCANLGCANLIGANLISANLISANLISAHLSNTNLQSANLQSANLRSANLQSANVRNTNFSRASLIDADLRRANLYATQALNTNFEGATLTGACIQDCNINSKTNLNGVICEYVYLKYEYNRQNFETTYTDRRPSDPSKIFAPGDFARLVQKAHETTDLIFRNGIDWQAFSNSFQALKKEQIKVEGSDRTFSVRAIENLDDGSFVVRINTPKDADKAEIEQSFRVKYDEEVKRLETVYRAELNAKDREIEIYKQQSANMMEIVKLQATRAINVEVTAVADQSKSDRTINIKNNQIKGSGYSENIHGSANTEGNTYVNENSSQDLASVAQEIQDLLDRLEKSQPTTTIDEQMAVATTTIKQIESNSTLRQRAIAAAKEGLMGGLKKTLIGSVVAGAIEGWTNTQQNLKP